MIRPALNRSPLAALSPSRRQWRWILGLVSMLVVAWPSISGLSTPSGQYALGQHLAQFRKSAALLNVLGEVTSIGRSTETVAKENQHMVRVLKQMDAEESRNRILENDLKQSSRQLQGQLAEVSRLRALTKAQIPLTGTIQGTTGSLEAMMQTVQQSARSQAQDMGQIVSLSHEEQQVMERLRGTSQAILNDDLKPAVTITQSMAGR